MGLVSDTQLAALRKIANRQLTRPFTCERKVRVETAYGFGESWTEVGSGLGWLRMMNSPRTVEQTGFIEGAVSIYRLHTEIPTGWEFEEGDRILMEGKTFEVHDVNDDDSVQIYRTCLLRLIQ